VKKDERRKKREKSKEKNSGEKRIKNKKQGIEGT